MTHLASLNNTFHIFSHQFSSFNHLLLTGHTVDCRRCHLQKISNKIHVKNLLLVAIAQHEKASPCRLLSNNIPRFKAKTSKTIYPAFSSIYGFKKSHLPKPKIHSIVHYLLNARPRFISETHYSNSACRQQATHGIKKL